MNIWDMYKLSHGLNLIWVLSTSAWYDITNEWAKRTSEWYHIRHEWIKPISDSNHVMIYLLYTFIINANFFNTVTVSVKPVINFILNQLYQCIFQYASNKEITNIVSWNIYSKWNNTNIKSCNYFKLNNSQSLVTA